MKKILSKIKFLAPLVAITALILPRIGHAQFDFGITNAILVLPRLLILFVITLMSYIAAVGVTFAAWAIEIIVAANQKLLQTPGVLTGFEISLSFVNLGFILAIVIIAIMTILRIERYGMKQNLWRLIVAALLVNFSLVFARVIINFADELTMYFLNAIGGGGISDFALTFGSLFEPQKALTFMGSITQALSGGGLEEFFQQVIGALFSGLMLTIVVIVMAAFAVMMLVRYVTLGVLVIIMPFVWLLWIFPLTRGTWDSWWRQFIRWNMFAPIVLFFVFLALKTGQSLYVDQSLVASQAAQAKSAGGAFTAGDLSYLQTFFKDFLQTTGRYIITIGLMVGGLYAANKFSITGAKAGLGAAKGATKAFGTYVARRPGSFLARTASSAFQEPSKTPPATGWGRINPLTWRAQVRQGMRQVGSRIPGAERAQATAEGFAKKFDKDRGLIGSLWQGAGKGSGLWGKGKTFKFKGQEEGGGGEINMKDLAEEVAEQLKGQSGGGTTSATNQPRQQAGYGAQFPPKTS